MKPFPSDSMAQYHIFMDALCQDWLEAGAVTRVTPRADAVCEVSRQLSTRSTGAANNRPVTDK